jgi:prevent-host-death family protein
MATLGVFMDLELSVAEARNRFTKLVHQVEDGATVRIRRRARAVAVLISPEEYARLTEQDLGFSTRLASYRASLGDDAPAQEDSFDGLRDRSPGREVEL